MPLQAGSRLGPYEVLSALGAGGMGEVWRARDTRLDRDVALKVLPAAFVADPERLARFEREAKVLASLNHPHIGGIHGLEESDGVKALVLELVVGPTLADRIARGPIPVEEALSIAGQIAEALEAAHEQGIIHRDLKPANIKIKPDGTVKVLDFGLAKALEPQLAATQADLSHSPTLTSPATMMGVVLGTAAYMAPEQARGEPTDRRSDIWSFGVVLFEMLSGRRLFSEETVSDTLAAVLRADIDWEGLPTQLPWTVRRLLRRCLERDRRLRLQHIGDARLELADRQEPTPPVPVRHRTMWRAGGAVLVIGLAIASYAVGVWQANTQSPAAQWHGERLGGPAVAYNPRISPDGQMLAFQTVADGMSQVGIMRLQSGHWTILTEDRSRGIVNFLAWAPDGSSLYFDRFLGVPQGIFRVPVLGGEPRLILDQAGTPEPLADGSMIVVRLNEQRQHQLFHFWPETRRVEALGGILATNGTAVALRASRDGREVVFYGQPLGGAAGAEDHLYRIDLESGAVRRLPDATSFGQYRCCPMPLAATHDGAEVLVAVLSGSLHRIVALPRSGSRAPRALFFVTGLPWSLDGGSDGALYTELVRRPVEILISDERAASPVRIAISNASVLQHFKPLPLPDGRILLTMRVAGRDRVMAVTPGGAVSPLLETSKESSGPMALVGRETVALMVGSPPDQVLALASTSEGSIERRLDAIRASTIRSVAGSPDGQALYYAAAGQVSALDLESGKSKLVHPGEAVAIDPEGEYAVVAVAEQGGIRLIKVWLAGGKVEEIPNRSGIAIAAALFESNAIARDGRIAVAIAPEDSFFWPTGILDPSTGSIEKAWPEIDADMFGGWANDGRLIATASSFNSSLWRFTPQPP